MKPTTQILGLMPIILIAASVAYYALGNFFLCGCAFVLALVFWLVLYGEKIKP